MYNRIIIAPGVPLYLGSPEGGDLLLGPPGLAPGAMSLADMQNRTWHLLREDGPDNGYNPPLFGDFTVPVVTRDLNIALGQFVSETGLAPAISDRMDTFSVFAGRDYPVPPSMASLTRIEYTPRGQQTYTLRGLSFSEFENLLGTVQPSATGQPQCYRELFAGYIRLQPAPGLGNATGAPSGSLTLTGIPNAGQIVTATFSYAGGANIVSAPYTVVLGDTLNSVAAALVAKINATAGLSGFMASAVSVNNTILFTSNLPGVAGTAITYFGTVTGAPMGIYPNTTAVAFQPTGDSITFYYSSLGTFLANPGDSPGIPPQFHMGPVYRVLSDYWDRKQDAGQSDRYLKKYDIMVARAKAFVFDSQRSSQLTTASDDSLFEGV